MLDNISVEIHFWSAQSVLKYFSILDICICLSYFFFYETDI